MRVAIYARMSTDKQSADSPADQIARCREFANSRGWEVGEELIFTDEGISGASIAGRPALRACLGAVARFDFLLCWEFSRIARDEGHLADIRGELEMRRKSAIEVKSGLDIFNIANDDTILQFERRTNYAGDGGGRMGRIDEVLSPRIYRLSAKVTF